MSCYYDVYGRYRCSYWLSTGAWAGIVIGILTLITLIAVFSIMRRRRMMAARNAILLQHQQQAGAGQWQPPPGQGPFGGAGGYQSPGYNNGPQPFQPGYTGGYTGPGAPKGYDTYPNTTPGLQEPARSYDPNQPMNNTTPAPAAPNDPPSYSGFSAPSGPPPGVATHGTGASNNPYNNYNPPDTTKT
ncbi:hypothetical protein M408DRAFT_327695 [Serendipita vermifera MAFF 305830]|uniref:Uncharacterized protein n=1 Tax=Serendipita vermifera MAFF 305830 TaxID=933852 RepID=A0A0C2XRE5_SERVB|nr:hypothetical protein M408DRAFT_327695 [Serendipita vermifera MAFF 305830]